MIPFEDLPLYRLPTAIPFKVHGESQRSYWIILSKSEEDNQSLQDFLSKILKALGLDIHRDTYQIIADDSHSLYLSKQLRNLDEPKIIISFGFKPEEIGLSIAHLPYQLLQLRDHKFLFCDLLDHIQNDANKKRALWETLQLLK
jgi:ssRNA-specific RNase YbeY (16S rRNA maturation enzyme)